MQNRSQVILTAAMLGIIILIGRADAIGKSTIDPNTVTTAVESKPFDSESDSRLAQKVTYEARYKTISAVLADLSKSTGVKLKAGYNNQDWQVRDRKMNIFVKEIPLAALMSSIARVMKFKWSISRDAQPWTYRLYMDRRTLLDAEGRRARRIQKNIEWQTKKREAWVEDIANVGRLSDQDLEKLKETNPYLYVYRKTGRSDALNALFKAAPDIANALTAGQEMTLNVASLPQDVQQAVLQLRSSCRLLRSVWTGNGRTPSYEAEPDAENIDLIINEGVDRVAREGANNLHMGWIVVRYGERFSEQDLVTPFPNTDFETTKLFGTEFVRSWETEQGADQVRYPKSEIDAAKVADRQRFGQDDTPEEKPKEHPDDPALQEKVKFLPEDMRLSNVLAELAKNSGLSIVSDSFGRPYNRVTIQGEMKIREILDRIEAGYCRNWEKRGQLLEFQEQDWFMKRAAQLPESWLEKWRLEARQTGTLDLGVLSQINELNYEQRLVNIYEDDVLGKISPWPGPNFFLVYDCLDANQQRTVTTTSSSSITQFTKAQISMLANLLKGKAADASAITIKTIRKQVGKHFDYELQAINSDSLQVAAWNVSTPEYTESIMEKPAQKPIKPGVNQ